MCGRLVFISCCFKQKTAYEMRISDWSSDVCSSDLLAGDADVALPGAGFYELHDGAAAALASNDLIFSVLSGQDDKILEESIGGEIEGQARHVRLDLAPVALARDQIVPSDILDGHFSAFLLFEKTVRAMATAIGLGGTDGQERGERGERRETPGGVGAQGGAAEQKSTRLNSSH